MPLDNLGSPDYNNKVAFSTSFTAIENGFVYFKTLKAYQGSPYISINGVKYTLYGDVGGTYKGVWCGGFIPVGKGDIIVAEQGGYFFPIKRF